MKRARYRLILVRGSDLGWLNRDRLQEVKTGLAAQHKWIPVQNLPFPEVVLYAYAADRTPFPTSVDVHDLYDLEYDLTTYKMRPAAPWLMHVCQLATRQRKNKPEILGTATVACLRI